MMETGRRPLDRRRTKRKKTRVCASLARRYIAFAQATLVALGKTPISWEEAIDKYGAQDAADGGAWPPPSAAINDGLAPGSVIQIWKSPAWRVDIYGS